MNALQKVSRMSSEEVLAQMASSDLREYGIYNDCFAKKIQNLITLRKEEQISDELVVNAALNNADTKGVLLTVLKENVRKVLEGMAIAAYAMNASRKILYLPEYAAELEKELEYETKEACVEIVIGVVNGRANKYNLVSHIITMIALSDIFNGNYTQEVYISVNGGVCMKYGEEQTVSEVLRIAKADVSEVKAYETGYVFSPVSIEDQLVRDAKITNGVLNVMTSKNCMIQETSERINAYRKQSCGKCVFCREGLIQLYGMENDIRDGKGKPEYIEMMKEIGSAMVFSTACSLGQEGAKLALSSVELLLEEYEEHIKRKSCSANVCFNKPIIYIDPRSCIGCEECAAICPKDCIEGKKGFIHMIDEFDCIQCGNCMEVCKNEAIIQTAGKMPKLPERLIKCGKFKKH